MPELDPWTLAKGAVVDQMAGTTLIEEGRIHGCWRRDVEGLVERFREDETTWRIDCL